MDREQLKSIYPLVVQGFTELGLSDPEASRRTILLEGGFVIGQRFDCGQVRAVMLLDGDAIEFYGPGHHLLKVVALAERRRAA